MALSASADRAFISVERKKNAGRGAEQPQGYREEDKKSLPATGEKPMTGRIAENQTEEPSPCPATDI